MDDQMNFFFQRKKLKLQEIRTQKREEAKQLRRDKWASKLQPLGSFDRNCCKKQCVNGGIPFELLKQTREVRISSIKQTSSTCSGVSPRNYCHLFHAIEIPSV
jgi:hypothetical protein